MGNILLESSRDSNLPDSIDENYLKYQKSWNSHTITNSEFSLSTKNSGYIRDCVIHLSSQMINDYFLSEQHSNQNIKLNILEIFAGNCHSSNIIYNKLINSFDVSIHSTDIIDHSANLDDAIFHNDKNHKRTWEFNIDAVNAIESIELCESKYNILLLICPPPYSIEPADSNKFEGYADYFAIKRWVNLENSQYIIFIGELGASDGSTGLYKYMIETLQQNQNQNQNYRWILDFRKILSRDSDPIFNSPIEKELFIFKKII